MTNPTRIAKSERPDQYPNDQKAAESSYEATDYLTNIRWVTVCLVVAYHVCYLFNGVGIPGAVPGCRSLAFFDTCASIVYPWFMVLLFLVAGMDSYYALQKYSPKTWIKTRTVKLLIPSTLGLLVWQWVTGYLTLKAAGTLHTLPGFLAWPILALSGTGPLWFVQVLYLNSLLLALLEKLGWSQKLRAQTTNWKIWAVLLLGLILYGAGFIGNMPVLTMYRFGIYLAAYLIGYLVLSHLSIQDEIEKAWIWLVPLALALGIIWTIRYYGKPFSDLAILENGLTVTYLWIACLAILGSFKKFFNQPTRFCEHMAKDSYGIYVLHYSVLYALGYLAVRIWHLPAWPQYLLLFILGYPLTLALFKLFGRIPVVRLLVLGISQRRKEKQPGWERQKAA